jgi:hypothetical protein
MVAPDLERVEQVMKPAVRAVSLAVLICLGGCANYYSERHFDRGASAGVASRNALEPDRATVYLFRERAWGQALVYVPIPPLFFAVNDQLASVMPLGSHVRLSLPPGTHKFSRLAVSGGGFLSHSVQATAIDVQVQAGKTYHVGVRNGFPTQPFGLVSVVDGEAVLRDTEPAKLLHASVSVGAFEQRINSLNSKPSSKGDTPSPGGRPGPPSGTTPSDALPTQKQIGEALEGIAAVAIIALAILAGVAIASRSASPQYGATSPYSAPSPMTSSLPAPPRATVVDNGPSALSKVGAWQNSYGSLSDILQSKDRVVLRNMSSGVSYEIEDGRIKGSDGSGFTVRGPNIFSDTGASYQVIGNTLFASDGRSCTKTGIVVSCP